jgi:coiled-coil domain-containing protein 6
MFEGSAQMRSMETEERQLREKNMHLQRKLQQEIERREALSRHLSESESSLELEADER